MQMSNYKYKESEYENMQNISNFLKISVLARAIWCGYRYAGIYSHYAKFFATTHFSLALCRNEATILKKNVHKI